MNTAELKNDLYELVGNTDNDEILSNVKQYFLDLTNGKDWWNELSDSQKASIHLGIKQLDEKKVVSHAAVREKVNKLLNKT
jgi:hypothetical protein